MSTTCEVCGRGPAPEQGGVTIYRANPVGLPGIWRCTDHRVAPVEHAVQEIVDLLEANDVQR